MSSSQHRMETLYRRFFGQFGISPETGIVEDSPALKFATFPYIGRGYGKSKRILFIGLDVGSDEFPAGIISLAKRRQDIGADEKFPLAKYNPHIAGTTVAAIYFSNPALWRKIRNAKSYHEAIRLAYAAGAENPLRSVALTNFYKFVTVGRAKKMGGENRKHLMEEAEAALLLDEVRILAPDIIFFQGKRFLGPRYEDFIKSIKQTRPKAKIVIGLHPSNWTARTPASYIQTFRTVA